MTTGNQWYLTIYLDNGTQGLEELNIIIDDNLSPNLVFSQMKRNQVSITSIIRIDPIELLEFVPLNINYVVLPDLSVS